MAYSLISIAAPVYLHREHQLRWSDVVFAILRVAFMIVPVLSNVGIPGKSSLFPVPAVYYNVFSYLFLMYLVVGAGWFLHMRFPEIINHMGRDIKASNSRSSDLKKV
ncbi:hypothetical protein [Phormidesmis sp. 146-33]